MNVLFYVTFLKIIFLYKTSIINCENKNKIFVCDQNNIIISYDTSNDAKSKLPCLPLSQSCVQNEKSKNIEFIKEPKYKGPEISEILQSGIQETIKFSKKNTDKATHRFHERDNIFVDIPCMTKGFKFRAFAPDNFLTLRNLYNISEDFDTSFQTSTISYFKFDDNFMDTFYYTKDYKFYIDIITIQNFEFIVSFLPKYFSHFCKNQLSLLPKISGLFHLKHKNFELYYIVKPYLFPNVPRNGYGIYYTKGLPENGALYPFNELKKGPCYNGNDITLLYNELILPSKTHESLQKILFKDTEFLKSLDISDYIFMLSACPLVECYNELSHPLVNKLSDVTNPYQYNRKTGDKNAIAYIGIENIYQKIKKGDQSYYKFHHMYCRFNHQVNQNNYDYRERFVNLITKQLFKSNGK